MKGYPTIQLCVCGDQHKYSPEAVVKSHKECSSLPPLPADKTISCDHHHVQCLTEALCQKPCPLIGWMREPTAPPCTATPAWLAQIQDGRGVSTALPHPNLGRAAMNKVWSVSFLLRSKMADLPATPPAATRGTGYIVERWYRTGPSSTKWCQPISADIATVKRGIHIPDIPFLQVTMELVPLVQHSQPA